MKQIYKKTVYNLQKKEYNKLKLNQEIAFTLYRNNIHIVKSKKNGWEKSGKTVNQKKKK